MNTFQGFGPVCLALVGCFLAAVPRASLAAPSAQQPAFYVDSHGWHSGIVVPRAAIPRGAWPPGVVERDFAGCEYLEIGWGDRKFYTAKKPGVLLGLDAAFSPGPSVLHVVGLHPPLAKAHAWSALVEVNCTPAQLTNLCRDLGRSFATGLHSKNQRIGPGLYGRQSGFYPARGTYWIGNTCNNWTAREMRAGGLPADPSVFGAFTSGQVVSQASRLARARSR